MAIVSQNAGKQGFFVISGRNSGKTTRFSLLFMQNKANLPDAQMNVNSLITKDYRENDAFAGQKNKPNSNPIKPNCRKSKIDAKCVFTKDYEEKCG